MLLQGYSVWLDLVQDGPDESHAPLSPPAAPTERARGDDGGGDDAAEAVASVAAALGLAPVPAPHVTALYGADHLDEAGARAAFARVRAAVPRWPRLRPVAVLADVELAGVGDGQMDMAWAEITFASDDAHEARSPPFPR